MKKKFIVAAATALMGGSLAIAVPAGAAVVPNIFQRSCYFGCSAFVQSNGVYKGQYPSECITHSWGGTSSYVVGAYDRCP